MNLNQVTLPAIDVARSVAFYQALGLRLIVDARPRYVRFECPKGEATLSLHQVATIGAKPGAVVYFECDDLDDQVARLKQLGLVFLRDVADEPWLWREARLRDPSDNEVCLFRAGANRRFPPWRVADPTPASDVDEPARPGGA